MIRLDAATVLLQWAVGGLLFLWVTTRGRLVGLGYGWLLRGVYSVFAAGSLAAAAVTGWVPLRDLGAAGVVASALFALGVSVQRRRVGVRGQAALKARRRERVGAAVAGRSGAMAEPDSTGADSVAAGASSVAELATASLTMRDQFGRVSPEQQRATPEAEDAEFPPWLDLVAPAIGVIGLIAAGWDAGGNELLAIARTLLGAAFLGAVSDAMLLGHWYLVQPGLPRDPIHELNNWLLRLWPFEVALLLVPTGMVSALNGSVDDGWDGMLSWFWVACALSTGVLAFVTRAALKERAYSAVMAATGLLYLAILTAFGTDLVARAILAS